MIQRLPTHRLWRLFRKKLVLLRKAEGLTQQELSMVAAVVRSAVIAESLQAGKGFLRHHFLGFLYSLGVVRLVDILQNIDRHGALLA